jgi:hypothetical protein
MGQTQTYIGSEKGLLARLKGSEGNEEYISVLESWIGILEKRKRDAEIWSNEKSVEYTEEGLAVPYCEWKEKKGVIYDKLTQPLALCDACKHYQYQILQEDPQKNLISIKTICNKFNQQFEWQGDRRFYYSFIK